jgi:hypothetical protein
MQDAEPLNPAQPPSIQPARFTCPGLWLTVLAAPVVGLVWARIGQVVQSYFAPAVLFPILVGVFTGLTVVGLVRLARIGHRPTVLLAAALAAAVAAGGQHCFSYLSRYYWQSPAIATDPAVGKDLTATGPALAREMAPGFGRYLHAQAAKGRPLPLGYHAKGWAAWLSWAIEAMLVVAAAVAVTIPAARVPYCNQCRSWYRTVRNGKIDLPTAGRLARLLDVEPPERPRSARYRLSACQGGCGPSRCELSWEHGGRVDLVRTWLDAQKRNEVAAVLDGLANVNDLENDEGRTTNDE